MSVAALSQRQPRLLDERMELEGIIRTDASFEEYLP